MIIKETNSPKRYTIQKLASYFKIKKDDLIKSVESNRDLETNFVYSAMLEDLGFSKMIYCVSVNELKLNDLLDYNKFLKSKIYDYYNVGAGLFNYKNDYLMALHFKGHIWFVYDDELPYHGFGAVVIGDGNEGFILEPMKNYLKFKHPNLGDEE